MELDKGVRAMAPPGEDTQRVGGSGPTLQLQTFLFALGETG